MIYLFAEPEPEAPQGEEKKEPPRGRAGWLFYLGGAAVLLVVLAILSLYLLLGPDATVPESKTLPDETAAETSDVLKLRDIYLPPASRHLEIAGLIIFLPAGEGGKFLVCDLRLEFQDDLTEADAHLDQLLRPAIVQELMKKKPADLIGPGKLAAVRSELLDLLQTLLRDENSLERVLLTNFFII
jgi:flagellar basal body-associated protein FliL